MLKAIEDGKPRDQVKSCSFRAFEWYCPKCWSRLHRVEVNVQDIVKDLPPLLDAFYAGKRECPACGHLHPGKG